MQILELPASVLASSSPFLMHLLRTQINSFLLSNYYINSSFILFDNQQTCKINGNADFGNQKRLLDPCPIICVKVLF